ncbi:amino acid permease [Candidatus Protochlamydia amoebophila]|uniref:amino acid permease n=1 Tax=Candidatus Protochlamydia amoebophila TaxID=362787 RepID=UPI001BCA06A1|nr:aromatic amino acid transport family protein [Candidatus Protochlamydia amoebophila]
MDHQKGSILNGSLLVAGTSIGGGMLALPVLTSLAGFFPSLAIYVLCWLFMASTGLLFLEVSQWIKGESNIITMAEKTLGKGGRYFAWIVYLFLFYCLTIAYMVGCGNIVVEFSQSTIPDWLGPIIFVLLFSPLILIPTAWAGRLNVWLIIGLALSYLGFVLLGFRHIDLNFVSDYNWSYSLMVLPIAFTSFAYQGIIPTLASYLHHDAKAIRTSILIGSFIPLIAYIIWEGLILGIVPKEGPGGLIEALKNGNNAVHPLKNFIHNPAVYYLGQAFAFFALITSFLGVTLGLRDFLADGLNIHKNIKGKMLLALLIFAFPLLISISYPHIFLIALDYAGGFGVALLLGFLPILMTWIGRYRQRLDSNRQLPGGKMSLILLGVFVVFELFHETKHLIDRIFS